MRHSGDARGLKHGGDNRGARRWASSVRPRPIILDRLSGFWVAVERVKGIEFMTSSDRTGSQKRIEQFRLLRTLVAFLGEKDQCGWWDTSFLGSVGRKYLGITCPRSFAAAGVLAASEAARRLHDARIGKGRVYHLFRLPHAMEQKVHRCILTEENAVASKALESKESALKELAALAREPETQPDGPIKLGGAKTLASPTVVSKLAGIYLDAFRASKQTMPYFTATE